MAFNDKQYLNNIIIEHFAVFKILWFGIHSLKMQKKKYH